MPKHDNYEVCIHVDGEKLPEYEVQSYSTTTGRTEITCWIPSEVGKAFEIYYKDSIRGFDTAIRTSVDGNQCPGRILQSRKTKPLISDSLTQKGFTISSDSYRPFVFANCQLTDEDEFASSSPDPGRITVAIEKIAVGEFEKGIVDDRKPFPEPKVHERSKKGLVHGIQLGPECFQERKVRVTATTIQYLVTFKFNYRPLDKLQADGIVPPPTPSSAVEARIQALKEELCLLEAIQHQMKRKRSDSKTPPRSVKKERPSAPDNNVIDLT